MHGNNYTSFLATEGTLGLRPVRHQTLRFRGRCISLLLCAGNGNSIGPECFCSYSIHLIKSEGYSVCVERAPPTPSLVQYGLISSRMHRRTNLARPDEHTHLLFRSHAIECRVHTANISHHSSSGVEEPLQLVQLEPIAWQPFGYWRQYATIEESFSISHH